MSTANHALAVLALLFAAVWAQAEGAPSSPTPAGTVLGFRASARYLTGSGTFVESPFSNLVSVTVLHVANTVVRPGLTLAAGEAGTVARLPLTVTNLGNGPDTFALSASSTLGWEVQLRGTDGEPMLTTPVLGPGESALVLASVVIPPVVPEITRAAVAVTASSSFDPTRTSTAEVTFVGLPHVTAGDLNGDGAVTVADITLAFRIAMGWALPSPLQLRAGDVAPPEGDGRITVGDAVRIARIAAGLEELSSGQ